MSRNTCAKCSRQGWRLDPVTLALYCDTHAPEGSIDTLPVIASQATNHHNRRYLMAGVRAEVARRLATEEDDDDIPF